MARRYRSLRARRRKAAAGPPCAGDDLTARQPGSAQHRIDQCGDTARLAAILRCAPLSAVLPQCELAAARGHLGEVGLADLAEQRAGTLSGGQAQRVAIARSLAQRPRVLLADEPVASLDPEAAEDIMRLLQRLARSEHLAVLCVLHQVELAYAYADRVVGIRDGRIAFDLPRSQVSREAVHRLYIHEAA